MIQLEPTILGEQYFQSVRKGPYIRVSDTQENHIEDGLKFWLRGTAPDEIERVSTETKDKGSVLHGYIDSFLKGQTPDIQEEWAKKPFENFVNLTMENHVRPIATELPLVSDEIGIGGRLDFVGSVNDELSIVDWKTGAAYQSHGVQTAIYMYLYWVRTGNVAAKLYVGQVHRDGKVCELLPIERPLQKLRSGLCTFERWKEDNREKLLWASAPLEVIEERKKLRGPKRKEFEESMYKPEYQWPWLEINSLVVFEDFKTRIERN